MNKALADDRQLLIFTDLDGTLLDHHSYSFSAAEPALRSIEERHIPLIINSSKTASEIIALQQQLSICQPFVSENGAAVYIPESPQLAAAETSWRQQHFAAPRHKVLDILKQFRDTYEYSFVGFADCDDKGIADLTGLSLEQARLAGDRAYSEPLSWEGSQEQQEIFLQQLGAKGFGAQQGGRFLTVMSKTANKAEAMRWLCEHYSDGRPQRVIALGDSPNDEPMLNAADIAVVIKSKRSVDMLVDQPSQIIYTTLEGPEGWQQAMDQVLDDAST